MRWIVYLSQNFPRNISFDLKEVPSLEAAEDEYREFCQSVYSDECSARLYPWTPENWETAQEFKDSECPFDHPSFIIDHGPRGGVRIYAA